MEHPPISGERQDELPPALKLFYGSGQGIDAVIQAAIGMFMLFYLTSVCGMSGTAAGMVFFLSLTVDAMCDPYIGRLSDRWRSPRGRRLPFMTASLLPMTAALVAIFSLPPALQGSSLFLYVLVLNVVLRLSLSAFLLPYSALTAELTESYSERSSISAYRALFIVIGTAACVVPAFGLIFAGDEGLEARDNYPVFGSVVALLVLILGVTCITGTSARVLRLPNRAELATNAAPGFFRDLLQLFKNPTFVPLFVGAVLVLVAQGFCTAINLHAYRLYWQLPAAQMQAPILAIPVGMIVGIPLAGWLLNRYEKREGVLIAVLSLALVQGSLPFFVQLGLLLPGSTATVATLIANGVLFGAAGVVCFICFYSMLADAVDEHDLLFGLRREALYSAALMLGSKAATGLGALLAGAGLQLVGISEEGVQSLPVGRESVTSMGMLWGPGVGLMLVAAIPWLSRYKIDRRRHSAIVSSLAARGSAPAGAAQS